MSGVKHSLSPDPSEPSKFRKTTGGDISAIYSTLASATIPESLASNLGHYYLLHRLLSATPSHSQNLREQLDRMGLYGEMLVPIYDISKTRVKVESSWYDDEEKRLEALARAGQPNRVAEEGIILTRLFLEEYDLPDTSDTDGWCERERGARIEAIDPEPTSSFVTCNASSMTLPFLEKFEGRKRPFIARHRGETPDLQITHLSSDLVSSSTAEVAARMIRLAHELVLSTMSHRYDWGMEVAMEISFESDVARRLCAKASKKVEELRKESASRK